MRGAMVAGKRIGLLTASTSRLGGGVFEAVVAQADLLRTLGAVPVVIALADAFSEADAPRFAGMELYHAPVLGPGFFGFSPQLRRMLDNARLDLLHLHGIWMYPSAAAASWAARSGKPYLISPHGMLDPWITSRGRWKKALARAGYERRSWRRASAFHALTEREAKDIERESGRAGSSLIIANAGPAVTISRSQMDPPTVVYLGRIHPKKGIDLLIDAWTHLDATHGLPKNAQLVIAGWGARPDVAELERNLAHAPSSVTFVGPKFGTDKARLLADARYLALPSASEGLPMVVLEAWAAGTPVLMSRHCNLPEGFAAGAAIEISLEGTGLNRDLRRALTLGEGEWLKMAEAARALASGPFSAATIASEWEAAYAGLMQGNAQE